MFQKNFQLPNPRTGLKLFDVDVKLEVIMEVGDDVERSDGVVVSF